MLTKRTLNELRHVNNYEYIHGDFDNDGVPNIDDRFPFDASKKQRVNPEVSMSETFKYIDNKRAEAEPVARRLAKENNAVYRIKDNYSTIRKAVMRDKNVTNDFIGLRVGSEKRIEAENKWKKFNKIHRVKDKDNKYVTNEGTSNPYRAFHSNLVVKGFGVEYQSRTNKYGQLNDKMHEAYKKKQDLTTFQILGKKLRQQGY